MQYSFIKLYILITYMLSHGMTQPTAIESWWLSGEKP